MKTNGGLVVKKQEMTRVWAEDKQVAVTLVRVCKQEVLRYKTQEKDGYDAVVVGVEKKELKKEKGHKFAYGKVIEFHVDSSFAETYPVGSVLDLQHIASLEKIRVTGFSKGKGFQGVMKRHNFAGGPASHGSKFHRAGGSTGNRKPRRTHRGHPMAGHMGDAQVTLRSVPIVDRWEHEGEQYIMLQGSVPGSYNAYIDLVCVK